MPRNLPGLFGAIANRNVVCFDYRGEGRTVEPRRLDFGRGRWYLTAHDRGRDDTRNFRLDRIVGAVQVLEEVFTVRAAPEAAVRLEPWELGGSEVVDARLLVDRPLAAWAERRLGADRVTERRDDGAIVVTVPVTNEEAFRSFVVEFLEHAEILEPAELRASYVAWLTEIAS